MSSSADGSQTVVIGVPVFGRLDVVRHCLASIDRYTPVSVPLVVVDDCGPERLTHGLLADIIRSGREWTLIEHASNLGFVKTANEIFELSDPHDTLLVNSDVEALPGWFEALTTAAADQRVASASALADEGGILSVPGLSSAVSETDLVRLRSLTDATTPIPVAVAHCTIFARRALTAVGGFDVRFSPGYGEEVDWSLRAARAGYTHSAALGSFVLHAGSASFGRPEGLFSLRRRHEVRLLMRYPLRWFGVRRFARDANTGLAVALARFGAELGGR